MLLSSTLIKVMFNVFSSIFSVNIQQIPDDEQQQYESEKWINAINRGELVTIDNSMYDFLVAIE